MRTTVVLLSFLMLTGCTALVVGGSADGGYQTGKHGRTPAVEASDSAISVEIRKKYTADPVVSTFKIGVRTYNGTVTLSGTVGSYVARDQALDLAKSTTGVKTVTNQIVVEGKNR